jgi:hypothetical protein
LFNGDSAARKAPPERQLMQYEIQALNERVERESQFVPILQKSIQRAIIGQRYLVDRLLIGILCDGHVLIEGVPGLAKTLSVKTLAASIDTKFRRIQFTPDLLPADLVGTEVYNPRDHSFTAKKGPIFANFILADEINRAPAKVQSALLECMQERQVTIGDKTYPARVSVPRARHAEPDRAGRNLSASRGAGRPLHAQAQGDVSRARRGEADHGDGDVGCRSSDRPGHQSDGPEAGAADGARDLHGREGEELHPRRGLCRRAIRKRSSSTSNT